MRATLDQDKMKQAISVAKPMPEYYLVYTYTVGYIYMSAIKAIATGSTFNQKQRGSVQ